MSNAPKRSTNLFVANLLGKLCTKFHPNDPSFVEDITKNNSVSFFRTHCI